MADPSLSPDAYQAEIARLQQRIASLEAQLDPIAAATPPAGADNGPPHALIFDQLPVPLVIYRPDGTAVAINQRNEQLVGASRSVIVGRHNIYRDPEARAMGYVAHFDQAKRGEVVTMPPTSYHTGRAELDDSLTGWTIWSETTYFPIRDAAGAIQLIGEVNLDVTERMRAEIEERRLKASMREREERFRILFEGAAIGISIVSLDGRILESNAALQQMLGFSAEELASKTIADVAHPADEPADKALFAELIRQERLSYRMEKRFVRKDGRVVVGHLTRLLVRSPSGDVPFVISMLEDITARKQAEEAQRTGALLLQTILDQLPLAVSVRDAAGRYLLTNRHFAAMFGSAEGQADGSLVAPPGASLADRDRDVLERGEMLEHEDEVLVGGERCIFLTTRFPLYDPAGQRYAVCSIAADITTRRRAEQERLEMERSWQATQRLESLGVLAGGIAHDFNNMLAIILGNAGLAALDLPADSPIRPQIDIIHQTARRAADVVKQLLAYAGKAQLAPTPVDLSLLVHDITPLLVASVSKSVTLVYELADDLPALIADTTQIRQVVMNLVINANEAIGEREGTVTVRTAHRRLSATQLATFQWSASTRPGDYVILAVSDTGHGMGAATMARVVEPFFTTKFAGRGLGLAVVLGIVQQHSGALRVESALGAGSTFTVALPVRDDLPASVAVPPLMPAIRRPARRRGSRRLLVADDEAEVRRVAVAMLERLGWEVTEAADGVAALEILERESDAFGGVLLDLVMPRLGGVEVAQALRQMTWDVPVVMMSGYSVEEASRQLADAAVSGFLQKPFTFEALRETLADAGWTGPLSHHPLGADGDAMEGGGDGGSTGRR